MVVALVVLGVVSMANSGPQAPPARVNTFEFTVWRDTVHGSDHNGLIITLSEREAARASMLVLQNQHDMLPFSALTDKRFHLLIIGQALPHFAEMLNRYAPVSVQMASTIQGLRPEVYVDFSPVIVAINQPQDSRQSILAFLDQLQVYSQVVVVNFGSTEMVKPLTGMPTLLQVPHNRRMAQDMAAQALFGGATTSRPLPEDLAMELGLDQSHRLPQVRLAYAEPEYVGVSSDTLLQIEQIVREGIDQYAMPGCQVLVVKSGHVIYNRAFGYHTYERQRPVRSTDLYDLASITKVAGTTLAGMHLTEQGRLDMNAPLGRYFQDSTFIPSHRVVYDTIVLAQAPLRPDSIQDLDIIAMPGDTVPLHDSLYLVARRVRSSAAPRTSQIFDISLANLMTHHSGLPAGLPVGAYFRRLASPLYSPVADESYTVPVAEHFFLRRNYLDSMWNDAKALRPDTGHYRYSCVNMILMQRAIDSVNRMPINHYLDSVFYRRLGMQTMGYNPRERFDVQQLVPTSRDPWRGQMLCGTVHDPTAALMGGVSGNAGLFSNANDLAILGQMFLNGGAYGGEQYLSAETVEAFTQRQRGHRGWGFDKPPYSSDYLIAPSASPQTYGHTGFTGTCFWVDPENDIIFVFLSNRIHPTPDNQRINQLRIRQRIHQVIYDALGIPPRFRNVPTPHNVVVPDFLVAYQ
jgi:CubicO group peptidase (beta-lactamase class C family)